MRLVTAAIALLACSGSCFADIVTNGGFETGDLTGWTLISPDGQTTVLDFNVHSGAYAASMGEFSADGSLSQYLATIPGQDYNFEYWLQNEGGNPNHFAAFWNGSLIPGSVLTDPDDAGFPYTKYRFVGLIATSASTEIKFESAHTPAYWHLDDVSVVAPETLAPEFIMAFLLAPLAALALGQRRRRASVPDRNRM